MTKPEKKLVEYLREARAMELALVRDLQSQIAMTPRGSYRTLLERHLDETRDHAGRLDARLRVLDTGFDPVRMAEGAAQTVIGQALALGKMPLALVRGSGGEEKILKNARDAYASEALEIATYIAIERMARAIGDEQTAQVAERIRGQEEKMRDAVARELPKLAAAVLRAEDGEGSYDLSETGAADAARATAGQAKDAARGAATRAKRATRTARQVPGVAQAEGEIKGAVASEKDLPIPGYDDLTADEIVGRLPQLPQVDLAKVDGYERGHQNRTTILDRTESLLGDEPWAGYDDQTVDEIATRLRRADERLLRTVRAYERAHKDRASVMKATERKLAAVS